MRGHPYVLFYTVYIKIPLLSMDDHLLTVANGHALMIGNRQCTKRSITHIMFFFFQLSCLEMGIVSL